MGPVNYVYGDHVYRRTIARDGVTICWDGGPQGGKFWEAENGDYYSYGAQGQRVVAPSKAQAAKLVADRANRAYLAAKRLVDEYEGKR